MKIAVVCIGDELLKGFTINTNLTDLGTALMQIGLSPELSVTIPDNQAAIAGELNRLLTDDMDIIIFSGGLGPTLDDLTKQVIAKELGLALEVDDGVMDQLKKYWKKRGAPLPDIATNQALVPVGAEWLPNDVGTAPGLLITVDRATRDTARLADTIKERQRIIMLPGPPGEFNPMVKNHLIPYLNQICDFRERFTKTIVVADMPESRIEKATASLVPKEMSIAYCASPACVKVYLSGDDIEALALKEREIRGVLSPNALPIGISSPVEQLICELRENSLTLAVAESCTGGMIAAEFTSFPGSSDVFKGGFIVYSNEIKTQLLDVPTDLLEKFGAVSAECAENMVGNLCRSLNVNAGIAVTGIAGPGGGTEEKPVGLVYAGIHFNGNTIVKEFHFPGDRQRIRERTLYSSVNAMRALMRRK